MKVLIYCRVSTREQGNSGLGLDAQKARCIAEVQARGWEVARIVEEVQSAGKRRPELDAGLRLLDVGACEVLMVSRIDRLARSVGDLARYMDRAQSKGWSLVLLDPAVDMSTPYGRMMAQVAMSFAELERALGSIRTKEGLERARARGTFVGKLPYGQTDEERRTIRRIVRLRVEKDMPKIAIARWLTEHGVPTPNGGPAWNHRSVGKILKREDVD